VTRSLLNDAVAHIGGQARQSQGRTERRPKGGAALSVEDEYAARDSTGHTRCVAPAFESYSASKHLRMVEPPSGRRSVLHSERGKRYWSGR